MRFVEIVSVEVRNIRFINQINAMRSEPFSGFE